MKASIAELKWCPFATAPTNNGDASRTVDGTPRKACRCITINCMAWKDTTNMSSKPIIPTGYCQAVIKEL